MTESTQQSWELTVLDASRLQLRIDNFEDLILSTEDSQPPRRILAHRCFPVTHRSQWIAMREVGGDEIGVIRDISGLDADSRRALETELARTYVLAQITRIHDILDTHGVPAWQVETNRGPRTIEISSGRRDIRLLSEYHVMIRDADGNHYEIPDFRQLDAGSRSLLETQI